MAMSRAGTVQVLVRSLSPDELARERADTEPDGVPIETSDETTKPRCSYCGGEAIGGGPIVPDEAMVRERWELCAFGEGWRWCWVQRRFMRA